MNLKEKFKLLLKNEGISQVKFAEEICMNYTQVSNFINGHKKFNYEFLEKVMERFPNVDLNWLLREENEGSLNKIDRTYSKPDTTQGLIDDITLKFEKLKAILPQK